jgi:hypothetical protein
MEEVRYNYAFSTSSVDEGDAPASRNDMIITGKISVDTHRIGGWVGPENWSQWKRNKSLTDAGSIRWLFKS